MYLSIGLLALVLGPASLASFSLDMSGLVDFASLIFNSLSPIIIVIGGIVLGLGLVGLVLGLVLRAVQSRS
jgi:hypothetical protein